MAPSKLLKASKSKHGKSHHVQDDNAEVKAEWLELFFDLIYVATIVHISKEIAESITRHGGEGYLQKDGAPPLPSECRATWKYAYLFTVFAQWLLLIDTWRDHVFYVEHFVFESIWWTALRVCYMGCVILMGVCVADNSNYHFAFLGYYVALKMIYAIQHLRLIKIPISRSYAVRNIIFASVSIVLSVIAMMINRIFHPLCEWEHMGIFFALWMADQLDNCAGDHGINTNIPHMVERTGLFTLIILGESLISVVTTSLGPMDHIVDGIPKFSAEDGGIDGVPSREVMILVIVLTFVMSYIIGSLYFSTQPTETMLEHHRDKHSAYISWPVHQVLYLGLLGWGDGVKLAGKHLFDEKRIPMDVILPGGSLIVLFLVLIYIRKVSPFGAAEWIHGIRLALLVLMLVFVVVSVTNEVNQFVIFMVLFTCTAVMAILDVEGRKQHRHHKALKKRYHSESSKGHSGSGGLPREHEAMTLLSHSRSSSRSPSSVNTADSSSNSVNTQLRRSGIENSSTPSPPGAFSRTMAATHKTISSIISSSDLSIK